MKKLERLKKAELIILITEIRPKADAYDRVCEQLGIENNILGFIKNLDVVLVCDNCREPIPDKKLPVDCDCGKGQMWIDERK